MQERVESIIKSIKANDIKIISFDIFDTLLIRNTTKPEDIFYLMQKQGKIPEDFAKKRISAEKAAREKSFSGEVTLEDIYNQYALSYGISANEKKYFVQVELDTEADSLSARKEGLALFREAVNSGKEIVFLTDMYLPSEFIKEQLIKNGYMSTGKLYLSCEVNASKYTTTLYNVLKKDYAQKGVKAEEILHVGDNYISDYQNAKGSKICAAWLPAAGGEGQALNSTKPFKTKVKKLLISLHLFGTAKKIKKIVQRIKQVILDACYQGQDKICAEIEAVVVEFEKASHKSENANVLVVGDIADFDKGTCRYVNALNDNCGNLNFILLNEAVWMPLEAVKEKIAFTAIHAPKFMAKNKYPHRINAKLSPEQKILLENNPILQEMAINIQGHFIGTNKATAEILVCNAYCFFEQILDKSAPKIVLIWNQFQPMHRILADVAKEKNINVLYMEFGCLPGTFALEEHGQMGESSITLHWEDFCNLAVDKNQMQYAELVLEYLQKSGYNRNEQPIKSNLDAIKNKLIKNRPTLLYAGQNDFESGMFPYTEQAKKYHSPSFSSSVEALCYLANIAEKNNWNLIYKPHPMMVDTANKNLPENVLYTENANINKLIDMCDVTITILSQVSYVTLIRQKPLVLLGFCQLKGKGCCYEAYIREEVEKNIKKAIEEGYTKKQSSNFTKHTAQLIQYYLYDDLSEKDIAYGVKIETAVQKCVNMLNK